ncbi:tRNA pseudouridine(55) synthase TruB, partial [Candidatus Gracilibacteria bacterium]|nr:tRNA pseudouridine(55) synthase TruB [Candidatus Gracilibacteria bacterium]
MKGFYLINKPAGMTSYDVIRTLKKKLQIRRIGHTGTLDPNATGLLLVAIGEYTKLIPFIENKSKTYECDIMLDGVSDSYDSDTSITFISQNKQEQFAAELTQEGIDDVLQNNFLGEISQIPPKYSAVKINGKKALNKVLDGETFTLKPRQVTIHSI